MTEEVVECQHSNTTEENGYYQCADCKVRLCRDCGSTASWWYSHLQYCKYDHGKAGYATSIESHIDPDVVLKMCNGNELKALQVIEALRNNDLAKVVALLKPKPPDNARNCTMK
jgi:hypothetical protein